MVINGIRRDALSHTNLYLPGDGRPVHRCNGEVPRRERGAGWPASAGRDPAVRNVADQQCRPGGRRLRDDLERHGGPFSGTRRRSTTRPAAATHGRRLTGTSNTRSAAASRCSYLLRVRRRCQQDVLPDRRLDHEHRLGQRDGDSALRDRRTDNREVAPAQGSRDGRARRHRRKLLHGSSERRIRRDSCPTAEPSRSASRTYTTVQGQDGDFWDCGSNGLSVFRTLSRTSRDSIAGLDDTKQTTVNAGTPKTARTNSGLVETTGKAVTVNVSLFSQGSRCSIAFGKAKGSMQARIEGERVLQSGRAWRNRSWATREKRSSSDLEERDDPFRRRRRCRRGRSVRDVHTTNGAG